MPKDLDSWVKEVTALCTPDRVHFCDGSQAEFDRIAAEMVARGSLIPLKRPGSFLARSHPDDVARVEAQTFICSHKESDAGPTNNWRNPAEMRATLQKDFHGCMQGRTMYVIPYRMGPAHSPYSRFGVEITDSPYVLLNLHLMTHVGGRPDSFVPGLHSVGVPLRPGQKETPWPCDPTRRCIAHFPEEEEIWSFGSGYGGNALLSKKSFALRIASVMGRKEGWLAEHMLILSATSPAGKKSYLAAAFPSGCGKTNLALLTSTLPGWKFRCIGDDIAWLHPGPDGRLYAINPEAGLFGIAAGTSAQSNPNALKTIEKNTIFTNVALTQEGDVWWEGLSLPPPNLTSWLGTPWDPKSPAPAAHPNGRFTVSIRQCPVYDPIGEEPQGVPISAILLGGKRISTVPLVSEAFSWNQGVLIGAALSSETTAATQGTKLGELRHDPFAMLPFCGYHMGDYFAHWIAIGAHLKHPPKIFSVNWFRKDPSGHFLWPGFGENSRVLRWVLERAEGTASAQKSPIGWLPEPTALGLPPNTPLLQVDRAAWLREVEETSQYLQHFGDKLPKELTEELDQLKERL